MYIQTRVEKTNLVNGQFIRIPLGNPLGALVHQCYHDVGALERHHRAGRTPDISSANAADLHDSDCTAFPRLFCFAVAVRLFLPLRPFTIFPFPAAVESRAFQSSGPRNLTLRGGGKQQKLLPPKLNKKKPANSNAV